MNTFRQGASRSDGWLLAAAASGVAYLGAGLLATAAYPLAPGTAGIWPGAGIAVAVVLMVGPRAVLGIFAADAALAVHAGAGAVPAAILALGIVGESLAAWFLLTRTLPFDRRLQSVRDVALFIVFGVVPSAILCVAMRLLLHGMLDLGPAFSEGVPLGFAVGFLGHGLGVLIVAPVLLTWRVRPEGERGTVEFWWLFFVAVALNALAFSATPVAPGAGLLIASFATVLWAALRFGVRETAIVVLIASVFATFAAGRGAGPFLLASRSEGFLSLSLLLLVAGVAALFLAAASAEKQRYLRRVADSDATHRALIEQMSEGLARLGEDGTIAYASARFAEILASEAERLVASSLGALVVARDRQAIVDAIDACRRLGEARIEVSPAGGDAEGRFVAMSLRSTPVDSGAITVVASDVTKQRRAETQASVRLEQLAHHNRLGSLDAMAAAIMHEVAQPVSSIGNYVRAARAFLASAPPDTASLSDALDGVERESRRAAEIVRRIRGFARSRNAEPTMVSVQALIDDAVHMTSPYARACSVDVSVELSGAEDNVMADPVEIRQVIVNLLRNAIEALSSSPAGERRVHVEAGRVDGGRLCIAVGDSGPGVPAELRERIFAPFFTTKAAGIGIGLALCQSIVEAFGGRLLLDESPLGGARFSFCLAAAQREVKR